MCCKHGQALVLAPSQSARLAESTGTASEIAAGRRQQQHQQQQHQHQQLMLEFVGVDALSWCSTLRQDTARRVGSVSADPPFRKHGCAPTIGSLAAHLGIGSLLKVCRVRPSPDILKHGAFATCWRQRPMCMKSTVDAAGAGARWGREVGGHPGYTTALHSLKGFLLDRNCVAGLCAALASAFMPMSVPGLLASGLASGVGMAVCPIPTLFAAKDSPEGSSDGELSMAELENGILVITFIQGSLGIVRICMGDIYSGCYTLLLATLGYNSRFPGEASNWLKTYVLITFINGTMSSIDLLQNYLNDSFPLLLPQLPLKVNVAHGVSLLAPVVAFLGAYYGWQYVKRQRRAALEAYNQQVARLVETMRWPPPQLPFPMPGMPGAPPSLPGLPGLAPMPAGMVPDPAQPSSSSGCGAPAHAAGPAAAASAAEATHGKGSHQPTRREDEA